MVNNDEPYSPASAFILSFSFLRLSPLSGSARAHLSGSPRGGRSPGHPSGWPADTLPPDSYRRLVLQVEDTRPREGGKGVDDGLWWARLEPRGPGSSAMIHLELLWRLIFSDDPFGASSGIDRRLDFVFWRIILTSRTTNGASI